MMTRKEIIFNNKEEEALAWLVQNPDKELIPYSNDLDNIFPLDVSTMSDDELWELLFKILE